MAELTEYKGKALIPLNENEPLKSGDRILIRFKWLIDGTWLRAYQWNVIEKKLEGRSDWRVISYRNEGDFLDAEIEVLSAPPPTAMDPGSGITQASLGPVAFVITVAIIGGTISAIVYGVTKTREQWLIAKGLIEPPVSAVGEVAQGLHIGAWAALIGVSGYVLLRFFRR
jgi:hypothetical protein